MIIHPYRGSRLSQRWCAAGSGSGWWRPERGLLRPPGPSPVCCTGRWARPVQRNRRGPQTLGRKGRSCVRWQPMWVASISSKCVSGILPEVWEGCCARIHEEENLDWNLWADTRTHAHTNTCNCVFPPTVITHFLLTLSNTKFRECWLASKKGSFRPFKYGQYPRQSVYINDLHKCARWGIPSTPPGNAPSSSFVIRPKTTILRCWVDWKYY